ncbi:hypothetical protein CDL15_Pgr006057 [Punica granatum]|uniref:Uncharacterized protein n=1 Tax=Punica granatum TaxID=22663 RepID=A0A218VTH4_PUNGR|nr:hypothetical protein CDL15_Pgr006057 [Punica granatum]PKI42205.1 hypothetical protein CRG98_037385 [Punica granatum]
MVTFFMLSSTSSSSSLRMSGVGAWTTLDVGEADQCQTRTMTLPMKTVIEVGKGGGELAVLWDNGGELASGLEEELQRSIFTLMRVDMRSSAKMEFKEDGESSNSGRGVGEEN